MARYTGTTAQRGYGHPHQLERARRLAAWRPGDPCARCGRPMWDKRKIDLGHTDDRTAYTGLEHRVCNRRDGQRKTSAILRAKGYQLTRRQRAAIRAKQANLTVTTSPNDGRRLTKATPNEGNAKRWLRSVTALGLALRDHPTGHQ